MTENNKFSISELQQKANDGDAQAQFELALCYANGTDVEKNTQLAFDWHRKAAEQGHVNAQFALGLYYLLGKDQMRHTQEIIEIVNKFLGQYLGENVDSALDLAVSQARAINYSGGNNNLAFAWLKKAAEQNHTEANYWLGQCYLNGIGTAQNDESAFERFWKAAEQEIAESQYSLACCYFEGKGIKQNDELGLQWCKKAAERGIATAQYRLAQCYFDGDYVEQNNELALSWLKKSAEKHYSKAQSRLADCYAQGIGVKKSDQQAYDWHTKAAISGHAKSQYWLARYYLSGGIIEQLGEIDRKILETHKSTEYWRNIYLEKGYECAFNWAEKAVENGCGEAYLLLGFMSAYGIGVAQNDKQAFEFFKKATEYNQQGIADYFLADFYDFGIFVEQSDKLAAFHSKRADPENVRQYYDIETLLCDAGAKIRDRLLRLVSNLHIASNKFDVARDLAQKNADILDPKYVDKAEQLLHKNQELEETNRKLKEAQKELEDMMSMFAHKFRSPLDAIIYNTTHENQVKLYTEAAQTMRGLLDVFSIISTDPDVLNAKLKQDNQGNSNLLIVFTKTLDMIMLHLLSASGTEKIQQHYMTYAKTYGLCDPELSYKSWYDDFFELEQQLQSEWEQSYAQLLTQSIGLEPRLAWLEQRFFKLELHGFDDADIHFKEHGVTESFLTILLNEILVNAFKYYSSSAKQPVVLEWTSRNGFQVLTCRNQSVRSERDIYKGSKKGHHFLSALARKTGSKFIEPILQDDFVVEFGIPNELLLNK